LAGAFFGKGFVKKESVGNRIGLIAFVYFLLLPLPAALLVLSMRQGFSVLKVLVLVCLLATGAYSLITWYMRSTVND
jgi:L-lactate permease